MSKSNRYFAATMAAGAVMVLGTALLAVKHFYPAYQSFLQFCGLSIETCQRLVNYLNPVSVVATAILVWLAITLLWQGGMTFLVVKKITARTELRPDYLEAMLLRLGLAGRVKLVPGYVLFCSGWLRPQIVIGRGLLRRLSLRELEAAIRHESYHLASRDPLKVLLATTLSRAFFFLPAMAELARGYLREKELAADSYAEQTVGKVYLGRALYKVLAVSNPAPAYLSALVPSFASEWRSGTGGRFNAWTWAASFVVVVILAVYLVHPVEVAAGTCQ